MNYIQGFVVPVPTKKKDAYREMCAKAAAIFKEYGATRVVECWGEDLPAGKLTDFRRAVNATADENVVFSWAVWPDRATCDAAGEKMRSDQRMQPSGDMPFDMKRLIFGGFSLLYDTEDES